MIKIALIECRGVRLDPQKKKDISTDIDIYWYPSEITSQELSQEIKDLKDFYDLIIVPELEDKKYGND